MRDPGASSISVAVRVRPFTIREAAQLTKCEEGTVFLGDGSLAAAPTPKLQPKGIRSVIKIVDDKCLVFDPPEDNPVHRFSRSVVPMGKKVKDQTFAFDRVFDENASQVDVYESTTRSLLDSVLDGYNATVFAYGATGCGKTHTITGTAAQPGIIFLTMQELFEKIADRRDEKHTEISLSYLEIYNETIRDLLVPGGSKQGLMLREDAHQAVSVAGLSSHHPKDVQEVMDMIVRGNEYRTMSPTEANATSSRSHAVLQINIAQKDRNASVNEPHTMATLSIIDLAGSERASATKNRGERLIEGANINKSLLALGSCINALCDPRKKNHIPYRNSKLTRLLKFSLGGNCKTVMIVCCSPSSQHFDETQNTLRYANRAKNIQTKVTRNVFNVNRHVKDFLIKIDEQMAMINELRAQQKDYETHAFAKFRKQNEKRESVAREGIQRIRAAYENSAVERQEKMNDMKRLRHVERRICVLSSWVAAFDAVCDARDSMPESLSAMRKTAQGILTELENSRHHLHQKINKNNWDRALESALQNSIRQVRGVEGEEGTDIDSLTRETELLRANAAREAAHEVAELEKSTEAALMQALLSAQFEIIASLNEILSMTEAEAVQHAKSVLGGLVSTCTSAASHVVKPDGSLEKFPPSMRGTPKKTGSPMKHAPVAALVAPHVLSPVKGSPRRRKAVPSRKGLTFTPKKKTTKRSVRWRDDAEAGSLADFANTPQKLESTPEVSSTEPVAPPLPAYLDESDSPLPPAPQLSMDVRPKNRFQAGFLSRKAGSPSPPSSDSELSPLRAIDPSKASNRQALRPMQPLDENTASDSGSDGENASLHGDDGIKIRKALRRLSQSHTSPTDATRRASRRRSRSPNGSRSGSPPTDTLFSASQARRMVKSDKAGVSAASVLSPRTAAIMKAASGSTRRVTISEGRHTVPTPGAQAMRAGAATLPRIRESVGVSAKTVWR